MAISADDKARFYLSVHMTKTAKPTYQCEFGQMTCSDNFRHAQYAAEVLQRQNEVAEEYMDIDTEFIKFPKLGRAYGPTRCGRP